MGRRRCDKTDRVKKVQPTRRCKFSVKNNDIIHVPKNPPSGNPTAYLYGADAINAKKTKKRPKMKKAQKKTKSNFVPRKGKNRGTRLFIARFPVVGANSKVAPWLRSNQLVAQNDESDQPGEKPEVRKIMNGAFSINETALNQLNSELEKFAHYVKLDENETRAREYMVQQVQKNCKYLFGIEDSQCQVFGSFAAKPVCIFESDIDLAIWGVVEPENDSFHDMKGKQESNTEKYDATPKTDQPHLNKKKQDRVLKWKELIDNAAKTMDDRDQSKDDDGLDEEKHEHVSKEKEIIDLTQATGGPDQSEGRKQSKGDDGSNNKKQECIPRWGEVIDLTSMTGNFERTEDDIIESSTVERESNMEKDSEIDESSLFVIDRTGDAPSLGSNDRGIDTLQRCGENDILTEQHSTTSCSLADPNNRNSTGPITSTSAAAAEPASSTIESEKQQKFTSKETGIRESWLNSSALSDSPKGAIYAWYGKKPRKIQIKAENYITWQDNGRENEKLFSAIFVCPISNEAFLAGEWCGTGQEKSSFDDNKIPVIHDRNGLYWYPRRSMAEHAAAARAWDCLMMRDSGGTNGNRSQLGGLEPYWPSKRPRWPLDQIPAQILKRLSPEQYSITENVNKIIHDDDDSSSKSDSSQDDNADKLENFWSRKDRDEFTADDGIGTSNLNSSLRTCNGIRKTDVDDSSDNTGDGEENVDLNDVPRKRPRGHSLVSLSSSTTCSVEAILDESEMEVSFVVDAANQLARDKVGPSGNTRTRVVKSLYKLLNPLRPYASQGHVRRKARVPIINLTSHFGFECDIALGGHNGTDTSSYARTQISRFKSFATLVVFLKVLLNQQRLDKPFTGGLGSYAVYVLVASHIEQHLALGGNDDPAEVLYTFLFRYGGVKHANSKISSSYRTMLSRNMIVRTEDGGCADLNIYFQIENCVTVFEACWRILQKRLQGNLNRKFSILQYMVDAVKLEHARSLCKRNVSRKLQQIFGGRTQGEQFSDSSTAGAAFSREEEKKDAYGDLEARDLIEGYGQSVEAFMPIDNCSKKRKIAKSAKRKRRKSGS